MNIYVAGSSAQAEEIAEYIAILEAQGWEVTYDWTKDILENRARPFTEEQLRACAVTDFKAVYNAQVLWYLVPAEGKSEGAAVELGAALAQGKSVIVSGELTRDRIFPRLADVHFTSHDQALEYFRVFSERRRLHMAEKRCHADSDGDCTWGECPQNKPETRKIWCPLAPKYEDE